MDENEVRNPGASGTSLGDNPNARGGLNRAGRTDPNIKGREVLEEAKQKASSLGEEAKEQGKAALLRRKEGAAEQLGSVAAALHTAADDLQSRDQSQAGRFVSYAADQLETFGRTIRDKDIDALIDQATEMGRRSPAAFFAGSVLVGFLVSRFLKSSQAAREHEPRARRGQSTTRPLSPGSGVDERVTGSTTSGGAYGAPIPPASSVEATSVKTRNSAFETDGGRYE